MVNLNVSFFSKIFVDKLEKPNNNLNSCKFIYFYNYVTLESS